MPADADDFAGKPRAVAEATCPRCGSGDVRRLSLIHQAGLVTPIRDGGHGQSVLSRYAAPPAKRPALLWTLLAVTATGLVLLYTSARAGTIVVGTVALLATVFAVRAARYNVSVYPDLHELWVHSCMCSRCGEIFSC